MGWYARELGLAANSITAIELVTADGRLVRATAEQEPELFWALRGGGGNFGVVTALELRLFPIDTVYAGMLVWDRSEADRVLRDLGAVGRRRHRTPSPRRSGCSSSRRSSRSRRRSADASSS